MRNWTTALYLAFMLLTRIPMPNVSVVTAKDEGRAFTLYPIVGLIIGALLAVSAWILGNFFPSTIVAAIILLLWTIITGALHLDGLGDSADGWLAGGDKQRTLEIMSDPRCGSAAVTAIACVLLLKFSALSTLIAQQHYAVLVIIPLLSRAIACLLLVTTPYAKPNGIAVTQVANAPLYTRALMVTLIAIGFIVLGAFTSTSITTLLVTFLLCASCMWLLRRLMLQRLQGMTGDTAGAAIEISEALLLLGLCSNI